MSVLTSASLVTLPGNGVQTVFNFNFIIPFLSDGVTPAVIVTYTNAGVSTVLTPSQYTIAGVGVPAGGTVTYNPGGTPIPTGSFLTIQRGVPFTQPNVFPNQSFLPNSVEIGLDNLEEQLQQINTQLGYTLRAPLTDPTSLNPLPGASARALQILGFDGSGQPSLAIPNPGVVPGTHLVYTSQYVSLTAADAVAVGLNGILVLDSNWALSANTTLNSRLVLGAGGIITRGTFKIVGAFWAPDDVQMFDLNGSGLVTINRISRVSVKWFGAAGDGVTNDANAFNAAVQALNTGTAGGGTVFMPIPVTSYNIGNANIAVTIFQNTRLVGEVEDYQGTAVKGVILLYSGTGTAIYGQNLLNVELTYFTLNMSAATGTNLKGIYLNGVWNSRIKNLTVKGMTAAKGLSIILDTNGAFWGAEVNLLEQVFCVDGIIGFNGNGSSQLVTATEANACFALQWIINFACITFLDCVAQGWTSGAGFAFTNIGQSNMVGCDIEGSGPTGISIDTTHKVREMGTNFGGFTGTTRISGSTDVVTSYGGTWQYQNALVASTPRVISQVGDFNAANYVEEDMFPVNVGGGSQEGYRNWFRLIAGAKQQSHQWQNHALVEKTVNVSNAGATTILTVPIPSGRGMLIRCHAEGLQATDQAYSHSIDVEVANNSGALIKNTGNELKSAVGYTGAWTMTPSGTSLQIQYTGSSASSSAANFEFEIRGRWTSWT